MTTYGPNQAGAVAEFDDGENPWSNTAKAITENSDPATCALNADEAPPYPKTNFLDYTGFGTFAGLLSGAAVTHLKIEVRAKTSTGTANGYTAQLIVGGSLVGDVFTLADAGIGSSYAYDDCGTVPIGVGGFNTTLSGAQANSSDFGVRLQFNAQNTLTLSADSLRLSPIVTAPAPTVTSVSANGGPVAGGTNVTITGTGFSATPTVTFGGSSATNVAFVNSTTVTCTTPAHAAGAVNVVVTNPDTQTGTGTSAFTYRSAPTVSSVSANSGPAAGGTSVTITGTDFATFGIAAVTASFGGSAPVTCTIDNSTTLTCTVPAHAAGLVDVVVTNGDGQTGTGTNAFTYVAAPTVSGVSASSGSTAGGTNVTVSGTGFSATPTITFGGSAATNVAFVNSTTLTCTTPAHAAGAVNVVVANPDTQTGTGVGAFTYVAQSTVVPPLVAGCPKVDLSIRSFTVGQPGGFF